jgi:hypothetical protein
MLNYLSPVKFWFFPVNLFPKKNAHQCVGAVELAVQGICLPPNPLELK